MYLVYLTFGNLSGVGHVQYIDGTLNTEHANLDHEI